MLICVWAFAAIVFPGWAFSVEPVSSISSDLVAGDSTSRDLFSRSLLQGAIFGFGIGLCWIATVLSGPVGRNLVRMLIVGVIALLMARVGTPSWTRHAATLTGMVIVQSLLFSQLSIPFWKPAYGISNGSESQAGSAGTRQFGIADLLAMTTAFACLLGISIRYEAPVDNRGYWLVMILFWLVASASAASCVLAGLANTILRRLGLFAVGTGLSGLLVLGLGLAEVTIAGLANQQRSEILLHYLLYLGMFDATLFFLAIAGHWQSSVSAKVVDV